MLNAPQMFRRKDMLTVGQICREIPGKCGGACSRQHVYNLIDRGDLSPAFRFGRRQCLYVPRESVEKYKMSCRVDVGA
jgi:hypothetical protein